MTNYQLSTIHYKLHRGRAAPQASQAGGEAALVAVVLLSVMMLLGIFGVSTMALHRARVVDASIRARNEYVVAQAETEDAVYRIKHKKKIQP